MKGALRPLALTKTILSQRLHLIAIKQVEILEGDGGPETIKRSRSAKVSNFEFTLCDMCFNKHGVASTMLCTKQALENLLRDQVEVIPNGGLIHINEGKDKASRLFKVTKAYLKEHSDAYN
ncbi:Major allergen Pru av [Trema orientale]|uniref:Major allergen Pru av n=1 Tax=Trema orientale TaxID=63057 RepID=A0A2P5CRX3_TREOI|nr:Major allergen Pru av [Trema orientale]